MGEVSVMEPLIKITDIEEDIKKEDMVSDLLLSSSEKFNFVLPDFGKVTLTENTDENSKMVRQGLVKSLQQQLTRGINLS